MEEHFKYKYEVHMHTAESSACGRTPAREYVPAFKEQGYDGIIITDHFFWGNTAIDRTLPWEDFVEQFCKGYEEAKEEGDKVGLKVFFGWEACRRPDEYLIYGPDKEWLKAHPEVRDADHAELHRIIAEAGGLMVGAHPFRERWYIDKINLHPFQCDAWEASNFGNPPYQDVFTYEFCKKHGIIMTSGTDLHDVNILQTSPCGMLFEKPLESIADYVRVIKSGKGFMPLIAEERRTRTQDMKNKSDIMLYDENNQGHYVQLKDIL